MKIQQIHHVAYRCKDAKETVNFYTRVLGMEFLMAMAENKAPSTKADDPYMHVFFDAGMGNILAFFELPNSPPMQQDPNTPDWVQHIALQVTDEDALHAARNEAEKAGLDVIGPIDHTLFKSIYFFDPNGHRIEITAVTCEAGNGQTDETARACDARGVDPHQATAAPRRMGPREGIQLAAGACAVAVRLRCNRRHGPRR